eukprot:TRINITY_DN29985_c0_g1_i1.p1 TRINITY_DN29985_c0_g1~~TRINITY_DN29985_c0_g1_i1.p1  ORF type:complete len:843 (-),score=175.50 TRINITY_DN29985_c0_g1_i1:205-2691(-)
MAPSSTPSDDEDDGDVDSQGSFVDSKPGRIRHLTMRLGPPVELPSARSTKTGGPEGLPVLVQKLAEAHELALSLAGLKDENFARGVSAGCSSVMTCATAGEDEGETGLQRRSCATPATCHTSPQLLLPPPAAPPPAPLPVSAPAPPHEAKRFSLKAQHGFGTHESLESVLSVGALTSGVPAASPPQRNKQAFGTHQSLESALSHVSGRTGSKNSATRKKALRKAPSCIDFETLAVWKFLEGASGQRRMSRARTFALTVQHRAATFEEEHMEVGNSWLVAFMINPSSIKRVTWDLISMVVLLYDVLSIPFVFSFEPSATIFLVTMSLFTMLFWTTDMVATVLTGFHDGNVTVLSPKRSCARYVRSWFALDALIVGFDWFFFFVGDGNEASGSAARLGRSLRTLRFMRALRLVRLMKAKRILQDIQDSINSETLSICYRVVQIILALVLANHIVACVWYTVGSFTNDRLEDGAGSWLIQNDMGTKSLWYRYMTCLHWSLTQFTPASMEVSPVNAVERVFAVIVLLVAMIAFSSFVSVLTASITELRNISQNESRQFWLLRRYLRDWKVPRRSGLRIQKYLEYAYQKQLQRVQTRDVQLLALLSDPLKDELRNQVLAVHLVYHPLFRLMTDRLRCFTKALSEMCLARGDLIFSCEEQSHAMFVVGSGMLQYDLGEIDDGLGPMLNLEDPDGEASSAQYVSDGEWVTEAVLWVSWVHVGDLEATTESSIVVINSDQFGAAMQSNTVVWSSVQRYAASFVNFLNNVSKDDLTDLLHLHISAQDVLEDSGFSSDAISNVDDGELSPRSAEGRRGGGSSLAKFQQLFQSAPVVPN